MKSQPDPLTQPAPLPELQNRTAVLSNPDGTPMHWSEAAKYPYGLYPRSTSGSVALPAAEPVAEPAAALVPTQEEPTVEPPIEPVIEPPVDAQVELPPSPVSPQEVDRVPWSASVRILVLIAVLALGATVIPFAVMNWESLEWSDWFGKSATEVVTPTTGAAVDEASPTEESAPLEAATAEAQLGQTLASSTDNESELAFMAPTGWDPVSPDLLADCGGDSTYLAVVAETAGPTLSGVFLNGMALTVLAVPQGEELSPGLTQQAVQSFLNEGPGSYDYFKILTPAREATVGGFYAQIATARITWNERVLVKSVCAFVAGDSLYQFDLQTDDVDWVDCQDLFERTLDSVALATGSVTPQ